MAVRAVAVAALTHVTDAVRGGPVMSGADVVAYFSLKPEDGGLIASDNTYSQEYGGYEFWFVNEENSNAFAANPDYYMPMWGGF
jgi:YHS domain-containing protein